MRKALLSIFSLLAALTMTFSSLSANAAGPSPTAASIFSSIGGTTTIDSGGAIHSQARSIYSLGGGQVSFQGKKISLLSADPPSYSAGCSGISWHFGGFAFISLDEIRQLVEAVAQASLGVAIDLAMQTLCPQCYAVMAKLRDIANQMRNAGADACQVAQNMGRALMKEFGVQPPLSRKSDCSKTTAESGRTSSWIDSAAGSACRLLSNAEDVLSDVGTKVNDFLYGGTNNVSKTPSADALDLTGNVTYQALTSLGYEDGFIKDLMLSTIGMTVMYAKPGTDCREAFSNIKASTPASAAFNNAVGSQLVGPVDPNAPATPLNVTPTPSKNEAGGASKGSTICFAPPIISGVDNMAEKIICGFEPMIEARRFAVTFYGNSSDAAMAKLKSTSLGSLCMKSSSNKDSEDPWMYSCQGGRTKNGTGTDATLDCTKPDMKRASQLLQDSTTGAYNYNGYTGLAWMIGDALYRGVVKVRENKPLDTDTIAILNGSGYPLYRILNMAAVYPGSAQELLEVYTATIATHYAIDTMTKVAQIGSQPTVDLRINRSMRPESLSVIREQIMQMVRVGQERKSQALAGLAEKRTLVEHIVQVNRAIQAEVISQGLNGNADLAVSIKRQYNRAGAGNGNGN